MSHVEQLERDTEQTRGRIADTLDELRACMTPGHVLDQLADRFNQGAPAEFARNLKDQAVNNPLPIALIGAGLAWLMLGGGSRTRSAAAGVQQQTANAADAITDTMGESAASMADSAREGTSKATAAAGAMADRMQRTASAGYEAIADGARNTTSTVSASARAAGQQTLQSGSAVLDFCREQPLVLAGLGIAVGAVMGALLPASDIEDRLLGETADRVKKGAQDVAAEQYEKAKKVGEQAVEAAKDEAAKQANEPVTSDASKAEPQHASEVKSEEPTLVPSDQSELERQGQPWTAENAPL